MNPTTSVSPSAVDRTTEKLDHSATFLLMILRFSLLKWLAQQSTFISMAQWCSELLGIRVTPREVVAYLHANIALMAVVFPTNMSGVYYLLMGIWVIIAPHRAMPTPCARMILPSFQHFAPKFW